MTEREIARLKPTGARRKISDAGRPPTPDSVRGLTLRVSPAAPAKTWSYQTKSAGRGSKQIEVRLGHWPAVSLAEARTRALEMSTQKSRGELPTVSTPAATPAGGALTFGVVAARYIREHLSTVSAGYRYNQQRRIETHFLPRWQNRPITAITYADLEPITDRYCRDRSNAEGRDIYACFSALMTWALQPKRKTGLTVHPIPRGVEKPGIKRGVRKRVLHADETAALLRAARTYGTVTGDTVRQHWHQPQRTIAHLVTLQILLGQRQGELQSMRWESLQTRRDGVVWLLAADETKNGSEHDVPLSRQAVDVLRERAFGRPSAREHPIYVFPNRAGDGPLQRPKRSIASLYAAAGITYGRQGRGAIRHDLRRTCGSGLSELGYSLELIGRVLNHKTVAGTTAKDVTGSIYVHAAHLTERREALQTWADHCDRDLLGVEPIRSRRSA